MPLVVFEKLNQKLVRQFLSREIVFMLLSAPDEVVGRPTRLKVTVLAFEGFA